ncbi:MAG: hydantoinase B/oxoprolinase family protein, partial [Pseudomonadota bacterium]
LEILSHQFRAVAEEMGLTLSRTARTTYVREAADFGTALATPAGKFFGYPAALGVSGFLDLDVSKALTAAGPLVPGDVVITNHPYQSGGLSSHMPDLQLVRPYFHDGELIASGWAFVHTADIGGMVPSSIAPDLTELFQEGLIIPPLKLVKAGKLDESLLTLYRTNVRMPDANVGDIRAMLAALQTGADRLAELIEQHGIATVREGQPRLIAYARAKARNVQRGIADGTTTFHDYLDDDFVSPIPVRVRCTMTARDGHLSLDFDGTDPQVPAAYNVPTGGERHPWLTLRLMQMVASHDPTVPLNAGLFDEIDIHVPQGTILNPVAPAAVGIRSATAIRINDVLTGCIAKAAPKMIPAPSGGTVVPTVLAEYDGRIGTRRVHVMQSLVGGTGARFGADGVDGRDTSLANCFNTPTETSEAEVGAIVEHYGLRPDSGGAGEWRGGTGLVFTMRILRSGSAVLGRGLERHVFRPWGMQGGGPGMTARVVLDIGTSRERDLGKISMVEAEAGQTVTLMSAGGGGYGDPMRRDVALVARDVASGLVSVESARRDYGVVIGAGGIDHEATRYVRSGSRPARPDFDFGPERAAWKSVFDEERMARILTVLMPLAPAARTKTRQALFREALPELGKVPLPQLMSDPSSIATVVDQRVAALSRKTTQAA